MAGDQRSHLVCLRLTAGLLAAVIGVGMRPGADAQSAPIRFESVGESGGVRFVLDQAPTADKRLIETMPGGIAAFDYNGDGRIDLFFANGAGGDAFDKSDPRYWNRLFRNDGNWKFTDVTEAAGVAGTSYAMGAAAADYDHDGDQDLFVPGVGRNQLFRNDGTGRFADVAESAGVAATTWSVAGAWLDYDLDGRLDLFVVNYVRWAPGTQRFCGDRTRNLRVYCHPKYFEGLPNRLLRNKGDGTFEDVTSAAGLTGIVGKGMSAAVIDVDGDRWPDLYVTNDSVPSVLLRNTGKGKFEEGGLMAGVALPGHGRPISAMGVDAADYDGDGRTDLAVTALAGETFPLYRNEGGGQFREAGVASGLGALTVRRSGWGIAFGDFDNDGAVDLFTANSHVNDRIDQFEATSYLEANRVYRNAGGGRFVDVSATAGEAFQQAAAHRGTVAVDLDDDGRLDVVTTALGAPVRVWRNVSEPRRHWLAVKLTDGKGPADGLGATVRVGSHAIYVTTTTSYASSKPPVAHVGLADSTTLAPVEVTWADGVVQQATIDGADRVVTIVRKP